MSGRTPGRAAATAPTQAAGESPRGPASPGAGDYSWPGTAEIAELINALVRAQARPAGTGRPQGPSRPTNPRPSNPRPAGTPKTS